MKRIATFLTLALLLLFASAGAQADPDELAARQSDSDKRLLESNGRSFVLMAGY